MSNTKKSVVSLSLDPTLISRVDIYAFDKGLSRSAVIEMAITGLLEKNSTLVIPAATASADVNSLVQPENVFATPALGAAICYS